MAWPTTAAATNDVISGSQLNLVPIKIAEVVLKESVTDLTFSNYPTWFAHLLLAWTARTDAAGNQVGIAIRMTPTTYIDAYDEQIILGSTTSVAAAEALAGLGYGGFAHMTGASIVTGMYGGGWALIPQYQTGKPKVIISDYSATDVYTAFKGTFQRNLSAFTLDQFTVFCPTGQLLNGSVFTLYGLP